MAEPVKGRTEAGKRREERARATRQRIVEAAVELFLDKGYASTTVEAIARRADVAPATVYQAFGTKAAILARSLDVTIAGDDEPVALLERDWVRRASREPDPGRRLAVVVRGASEVAAMTAEIKDVLRDAAATEPELWALIKDDHERRLATQQELVDLLIKAHPLRPGLRRDDAVGTFYALVNSESYRLLSGQLGWSTRRWQRWLISTLDRQLWG
jgi:AcrR family transcriptional regulator